MMKAIFLATELQSDVVFEAHVSISSRVLKSGIAQVPGKPPKFYKNVKASNLITQIILQKRKS